MPRFDLPTVLMISEANLPVPRRPPWVSRQMVMPAAAASSQSGEISSRKRTRCSSNSPATGIKLHIFNKESVFARKSDMRKWRIAHIERGKIQFLAFEMLVQIIDLIGNMRGVSELFRDRAVLAISQELDSVRAVYWIGH